MDAKKVLIKEKYNKYKNTLILIYFHPGFKKKVGRGERKVL